MPPNHFPKPTPLPSLTFFFALSGPDIGTFLVSTFLKKPFPHETSNEKNKKTCNYFDKISHFKTSVVLNSIVYLKSNKNKENKGFLDVDNYTTVL